MQIVKLCFEGSAFQDQFALLLLIWSQYNFYG